MSTTGDDRPQEGMVAWWTGTALIFSAAAIKLLGFPDFAQEVAYMGFGAHIACAAIFLHVRRLDRRRSPKGTP